MGVLLLSVFFANVHVEVQASTLSCSAIDLRHVLRPAQAQAFRIRDQKQISWCYAHSTADYLQYFFGIEEQVSAADIAIAYNRDRAWPKFIGIFTGGPTPETGFMRSAMWDAAQVGYCPESHLPSEVWQKRHLQGVKKGQVESVELKVAIQEMFELQRQVQRSKSSARRDLPFVYEFKRVTGEEWADLLRTTTSKTLLSELRDRACSGVRVPYPGVLPRIAMRLAASDSFARINEVLDQRLPVNIDYFYGVLTNYDKIERKVFELHSSLIVARRSDPRTGQCSYLIKNSYGTDCKEYDSRHQCESGYVWVNQNALKRALVSYVYLQK
jgi:hypothetical protein